MPKDQSTNTVPGVEVSSSSEEENTAEIPVLTPEPERTSILKPISDEDESVIDQKEKEKPMNKKIVILGLFITIFAGVSSGYFLNRLRKAER
jgi:hypothetical protein